MRIYVACNWGRKFAGLLIDWWKVHGHQVEYSMGYDPKLHEQSELCFVDVSDNNAQVASQNRFPNSKLVIRAIDIETWVGQPGGVNWANVDVLIFGAKHIEELVRSYVNFPDSLKVYHIPFGVDLSKWTYRERDGSGKKIAFIAHQWSAKGLPLLYQIVAALGLGWELHMLGTKSTEKWLHYYSDHIIKELGLNTYWQASTDNVDQWLEDKDYLLVTSQKEAYSYAAAESAAKGIKPLIHNFWGARGIWPTDWIWTRFDECIYKICFGAYDSASYRAYITNCYSLELMMAKIDRVCGIREGK